MNLNDILSISIMFGVCCFARIVAKQHKVALAVLVLLSGGVWGAGCYLGVENWIWMWVGQGVGMIAFGIMTQGDQHSNQIKEGVYTVKIIDVKGKTHYIQEIDKGVGIFGASGSGKSQSVIYNLLKHYAKWKFSGVIHDYKDFELSEVAKPLFEEQGIRFEVFAIHRPDISVRINPIEPVYIPSIEYVRSFIANFTLNILGPPKGDLIWRNAPEGILIAMVWRLKKHFPELCNLSFIVAILLQVKKLHRGNNMFANLVDFLQGDNESATSASTFLTAANEPKLLTSVYSALTDCLQIMNTPNVLYLLSKNGFDLNLTQYETPVVLSVVNRPATEKAQTPLNAAVIDMVTGLISKKGKPLFAMIDEAPTIKINGLPSRVATLRSYGVSFGFCVQDLVQGKLQNDGKDFIIKSTVTNLSTMALGKTNDSDTAKYYEGFFGFTDKEQFSYSKGDIFSSGDRRINKSYREQRQTRDFEFYQLKAGEFFMLSGGKNEKYRFKNEIMQKYDFGTIHNKDYNQKYLNIFAESLYNIAGEFIQGGYNDTKRLGEIIGKFKTMNN